MSRTTDRIENYYVRQLEHTTSNLGNHRRSSCPDRLELVDGLDTFGAGCKHIRPFRNNKNMCALSMQRKSFVHCLLYTLRLPDTQRSNLSMLDSARHQHYLSLLKDSTEHLELPLIYDEAVSYSNLFKKSLH